MQHFSVVEAKLEGFIHGLVSGVDRRVVFLKENKSEVGPSLSRTRIHIVNQTEHFLGFVILTELVTGNTKVEMRESCLVVLSAH